MTTHGEAALRQSDLDLDPHEADATSAAFQQPLLIVLENAETLVLDNADLCYVVEDGTVDLSLHVLGRRLDMMSLSAGSLACGYSGEARLVLRSGGRALLRQMPLADFLHTTGDMVRLVQQADMLDHWVEGLTGAVAKAEATSSEDLAKSTSVALVSGQSRAVGANTVVTSANGVIWVVANGNALQPDDIAPSIPTPLTTQSKLRITGDMQLLTTDTRSLQLLPIAADTLKAFVAQSLSAPINDLLKAATQDAERLLRRNDLASHGMQKAIKTIASAFDAKVAVGIEPEGFDPEDGDVHRKITLLGQVAGFSVKPLGRKAPTAILPHIKAICTANNLRWRTITLSGEWWKADSGNFLALNNQGQAVAVIRQARHYVVYEGLDDTARPFQPSMVENWSGTAIALYWPLPDRSLDGLDIVGRVFRGCVGDIGTLVMTSALVGILSLVLPVAAGLIVGTVIPNQDRSMLVEFGIILSAVAIVNFVITLASELATSRIEMRATTLVQSGIIDRLLRLPATFFRRFSSGELSQRAMAISRLERLVTSGMISGLLCGVFSFSSFGLMFYYAPSLALLTTGLALLYVLVALVAGRMQTAANREQVLSSGPVSSLMFEMALGIEKLRVTATETGAFERWSRAFRTQQSAAYRAKRVTANMNTFNTFFLSASTLAIFLYIGNSSAESQISTTSLVTFLTCFTTFIGGLGQLALTATQIAGMKPLYEFAAPILQATPENDVGGTDPGTLRGEISFNSVRFAYHDDDPIILNGIDLHIDAGEYVAIVGDSGCGKSTILRLLMAFESPRSGTVTVDGLELHSIDKRALRRQFGVVMQNARLMPGSIYDNIVGTNYGMSLAEITRAAELVGLADDIKDMPMGFQTAVSDSTGGLSGGQIQRIMLARAIVSSPAILILDEATSALDNRTQSIVTKALDELKSTRVVVAHRLSTILKADRIVVLSHGQVVETGTYGELMALDGHFAALAKRQLC